jgi:CDP-diglyceride synthetase
MVCVIYVLLGIATICFAIVLSPATIAYIYLGVGAFDASRRFVPRFGVAVGVFAALAMAILARGLAMLSLVGAIETWVWIAAAALAADLSASWLKRKSGIDRFGRWLPQGGVLDHFDGLLFAAPIALVVLGH